MEIKQEWLGVVHSIENNTLFATLTDLTNQDGIEEELKYPLDALDKESFALAKEGASFLLIIENQSAKFDFFYQKIKRIKTKTVPLVLINAKKTDNIIKKDNGIIRLQHQGSSESFYIQQNIQIIGFLSDLNNQQLEKYILPPIGSKTMYYEYLPPGMMRVSSISHSFPFDNPKDSFLSLLISKGLKGENYLILEENEGEK